MIAKKLDMKIYSDKKGIVECVLIDLVSAA